MFEYEIIHKTTNETAILFGHSEGDAFRRSNIENPAEWVVVLETYVD